MRGTKQRARDAAVVTGFIASLVACSTEAPPNAAPSPTVSTEPIPSEQPFVEPTWPETFEQVQSGVVRIASVSCDGQGVGSGFLVGRRLVATAAHVVEDAASISVRAGRQVTRASVVGTDEDADVALLELDTPVDGHVFSWAEDAARVGEEVAAVGFPLGQPLAMTRGAVTAVGRRIDLGDTELRDLVQTDAAINPGNSGGPLIRVEGTVTGVVSAGSDAAGDAYAIEAGRAHSLVAGWVGDNGPLDGAQCSDEEPRELRDVQVAVSSTHPEAASLAQTFRLHADAINYGWYAQAFSMLTPSVRNRIGSVDHYEEELSTTFWITMDVADVQVVDETTDEVELRFRTIQAQAYAPDGIQTCSDWRLLYRMVFDSGLWQIDRALPLAEPVDCSAEYED